MECEKCGDPHSSREILFKKRPGVMSSLFGGATAGAVAKTVIAPLDRTKIFFQVSTVRGYSFKSALKFVVRTYRENGFFSLFRGNSATMIRVMPYAAIQFASFEQYKLLLKVDANGTRTPGRRCVVGSMAGATATFLTYPLDTAKARLSVSTKKEYATLLSVFIKTTRDDGILALYRGLLPTFIFLGVIPYAGASFFTYETLKLKYMVRANRTSYRFTLKTNANGSHQFSEGLKRGLYKGLSMNWVKGPIAVGISFTTYEYVMQLIS
uniref:Mitochondrial carrier protein n=1 Tax=Angiostrongylus cantonensis TaxID=6313 RepID=A0A0K0CXQ7_ANGCA